MSQAPDFSLPHVAGRQVTLSDYRGKPVVLIVSGKGAADEAKQIGQWLGDRYFDSIRIISVIDMSGVPKFVRPVANKMVERGYNDAVKGVTEARRKAGVPVADDPADMVVFVRDAEGQVAKSFGLHGVEDEAAAVMVGPDGEVVATGRGVQAAEEMAQALGPPR